MHDPTTLTLSLKAGKKNKQELSSTECEYSLDQRIKRVRTFVTKIWKSETSDSRDSLVASATVASDATKAQFSSLKTEDKK